MDEHGRGEASSTFLPPPRRGDANGRELKVAPGGPPKLPAAPSAGGASALGLFRRKPPAGRGPPPTVSTAQLLPELDFQPPCRGVSSRPPHLGPAAHEGPAGRAGGGGPCLPFGQPASDGTSSRGDLPPARWWGFLPSGLVWMSSVPLDPEGGAPPALRPPTNICILTLAMMIAGIPTVPVPGVREEDMVLAAQNFMAGGSPRLGEGGGEAARRRRWVAPPPGDQQQRGRSLLPFFLAQLEQ